MYYSDLSDYFRSYLRYIMIKLEDIEFRVGVKGKKASLMLVYINARTARRELNERFGFGNWQFSYTVNEDKSVHGVLKVNRSVLIDKSVNTTGGWLEFHDVGYCSKKSSEPLKEAVSDATKRCAVQVGIGAFLYEAPKLFVKNEGFDDYGNILPDSEKILRGQISDWYNNLFPNKGDLDIRQIKNG